MCSMTQPTIAFCAIPLSIARAGSSEVRRRSSRPFTNWCGGGKERRCVVDLIISKISFTAPWWITFKERSKESECGLLLLEHLVPGGSWSCPGSGACETRSDVCGTIPRRRPVEQVHPQRSKANGWWRCQSQPSEPTSNISTTLYSSQHNRTRRLRRGERRW